MNCKHDNMDLMGTADGIICRRCNTFFKTFAEIEAARGQAEPEAPTKEPVKETAQEPQEKPKRARKKKGE